MQPNKSSQVESSPADQLLQQALGDNSGDSRLAGGLMSVALAAAVLVAGWRQLKRRSKNGSAEAATNSDS